MPIALLNTIGLVTVPAVAGPVIVDAPEVEPSRVITPEVVPATPSCILALPVMRALAVNVVLVMAPTAIAGVPDNPPAVPEVFKAKVFENVGVPVKDMLPLIVGAPVNVPDSAPLEIVVAVNVATVIEGVPLNPAEVPEVLAALLGMSPDASAPHAGAAEIVPFPV